MSAQPKCTCPENGIPWHDDPQCPLAQSELAQAPGSVFDRRKLTRLAVYNLVRNWMLDGCPMAGEVPPDEAEVWRILGRIVKQKPNTEVSSGAKTL